MTISDTSRGIQHEPDTEWPLTVRIELTWVVDGQSVVRGRVISSDEFFGRGTFGAPMQGANIVGMIENMRREGPPPPLNRATRRFPRVKPIKRKKKYADTKKR